MLRLPVVAPTPACAATFALITAFGATRSSGPPPLATAPEVYLADWTTNGLGTVTNISNNVGYDNQPQFTNDGKAVLFASNRDGVQTDIYRYDIKKRSLTRLTESAESEYAPAPLTNGAAFSVVRVEPKGVQRLWRIDPDGAGEQVLFDRVRPVSSSLWLDATHVALDVLDPRGGPATLRLGDTETGAVDIVATNVGRCLAARPKSAEFAFIARSADPRRPATVKTFNWKTRLVTELAPVVAGGEDVAWLSETEMLTVAGTTFYRWHMGEDLTAWTRFADTGALAFTAVSRIVASPDGRMVAFVALPRGAPAYLTRPSLSSASRLPAIRDR
jgi:hypothetical protein